MAVNEIFRDLSAHFVKGMMVHDKMADYYDFLSLRGYKRCHEYHFRRESANYRRLHRYYINRYHKLIEEAPVGEPDIIPASWYRYTRNEVDTSTKRSAIKSGVDKWITWETETLNKLQQAYDALCEAGDPAAALFIEDYIQDTECELKAAHRKALELSAVDYDMPYIMQEQKRIHDKYKRK